jgi:hypothetical protein
MEDNKAHSERKNIPPKLLEKFRTNIREGCHLSYAIVQDAMWKRAVVVQREDVMNWARELQE